MSYAGGNIEMTTKQTFQGQLQRWVKDFINEVFIKCLLYYDRRENTSYFKGNIVLYHIIRFLIVWLHFILYLSYCIILYMSHSLI